MRELRLDANELQHVYLAVAEFPPLAPHLFDLRVRSLVSRAATGLALADPAYRHRALGRVQEITRADGLLAAANIDSPAHLVLSHKFGTWSAYALAHAWSASEQVGISVPGFCPVQDPPPPLQLPSTALPPPPQPAYTAHVYWRLSNAERAQPLGEYRRSRIVQSLGYCAPPEPAAVATTLNGWDEFKRVHAAELDAIARGGYRPQKAS
ncbi:hypothetical protein H9P43_006678 [Blastocladiella emersonii ATCC 22665]|nr:hypothetical protein H9P43_006678 [Blastocladiella emersonii ATCC 22665]